MSGAPSVTVPIQLRFGDTDKLGHVNNAAYASFAEVGRLELLRSLGIEAPSVILARQAIDFRRQVALGDECSITSSVVDVGNTSITLSQVLRANGLVAADFEAIIVWFDYEAQRPARVPDAVRAVLTAGRAPPAR
jgi:acyl-CoA thioester hydrolase